VDNLTPEEQAIVRSYRGLSAASKGTILASLSSFKEWLKNAVKWVWEKIAEYEIHELISELFDYLKQRFFG